jgi:hypothetical protein
MVSRRAEPCFARARDGAGGLPPCLPQRVEQAAGKAAGLRPPACLPACWHQGHRPFGAPIDCESPRPRLCLSRHTEDIQLFLCGNSYWHV